MHQRCLIFFALLWGSCRPDDVPQRCEERRLVRTGTLALAAGENATLALDVSQVVARDERVTATLRASARGDFGSGGGAAAATAAVAVDGADVPLTCDGGGTSQCSAWHECAGALVLGNAPRVVAVVTLGDAVDWDYCDGATVAEFDVTVEFLAQRCDEKGGGRRRFRLRRFSTRVAVAVLALAAFGFLAAAACLARARCFQERRGDPTKGGDVANPKLLN